MRYYRVLTDAGERTWATSTDGEVFQAISGTFANWKPSEGPALSVQKILAPAESPPAIFAIGLNYRDHAAETGQPLPEHPVVFMKPASAIIGPGDAIELPRGLHSDKVDYEVELAIVIGRAGKNIPAASAMDHVLGFTIANDVSARDWQKHGGGGQWIRGKSFDTACPLGPSIVTPDEFPDLASVRLRTTLNGQRVQDSTVGQLIFSVPEVVAFLSRSTTLLPGTIILTGTPAGVGYTRTPPLYLQPGDEVSLEISGIGTLANPVIEEVLG